jgi:hypothetical protein
MPEQSKVGMKPKNKNQIFCSKEIEQDSHPTTEVTTLPPSFDYWEHKVQVVAT